ncbi:MAG TPA: MOSC domain-containing protein [Ktedonobacterales bacterium]|jgi:MOSC domain-containing protein YiiM|nr:MOSC domain-containing protein [Ktedonobacterales bacterium]
MTSAAGRIYQINVSRGGAPKLPITEARLTDEGIEGDLHDDIRDHGGPMRALCLFTLEEIERLAAEGHPIYPGAAGENVTLAGVPQAALTPGTRLALGDEVQIEVTQYTSPCKTIAHAFNDGDFTRISQKTHPGESRVYAKVLRAGTLHVGDAARVIANAADPASA